MKRDIALDIAKGIAMLLVIIGHCDNLYFSPTHHFIYSFHMPLFFLASGYLYKVRDIKETLKKDFKHLAIPYVMTCIAIIAIALVYYLATKDGEPLSRLSLAALWGSGGHHSCKYLADVPGIGPLWFLPALLICKNVYNVLPEKRRLLYSLVIFLVATVIGRYLIFLPFSILSGLSAIVFYAIGDHLKLIKTIPYPYWIIGIICWIISLRFSNIYLVTPQLDLYFVDVIGATTASLLVYSLSRLISKVSFLMKGFSWIGANSLYIFCFHAIENDCGIARQLSINGNTLVMILLGIMLPVIGTFIFTRLQSIISYK